MVAPSQTSDLSYSPGRTVVTATPDMDTLSKNWLNELRLSGYSENTQKAYRVTLNGFKQFMGGRPVSSFSSSILGEYIAYLLDVRKVGLSTVSHSLTTLKMFAMWLVEEGHLDPGQVPSPRKFSVKVPSTLPEYHSQDDLARVVIAPNTATVLGARDRAIMELLWSAGLRVSECVSLELDDVRMGDMSVLVRNGKGGKDRIAFFGEVAAQSLSVYLNTARPALCVNPGDVTLFLNYRGGRMSRETVATRVRNYAKQVGVKGLTPHGFRHGMATGLLEAGAGLRQIQELLGHASIMTTQKYSFVTKVEARRTFDQFHPRARVSQQHQGVARHPRAKAVS